MKSWENFGWLVVKIITVKFNPLLKKMDKIKQSPHGTKGKVVTFKIQNKLKIEDEKGE